MNGEHKTSLVIADAPRSATRERLRGERSRRLLQGLIAPADVRFNGARPWDIRVHDPAFYDRVVLSGSMGLGQAYVDGQWDASSLDETCARLIRAGLEVRPRGREALRLGLAMLRSRLQNRQTPGRAFEVAERHYDIGNGLYRAMLDPTMSYSCGYWEHARTLAEAQTAKLDLICRKLDLQPGERLLDVGCGWGGLAEHAARRYGVEVLGITISREQASLARERCQGLPVEIQVIDYRSLRGRFDKVASVGMFEHVGHKNYPAYFRAVVSLMREEGLFLLHTIGTRSAQPFIDPWIERYIFPNAELPSAELLARAFRSDFVLEDWHAFGQDYDRTLLAWWVNFDRAWPEIAAQGYDARFYRMWKYYLHGCAGFFRARSGQLWQLVLSRPERREVYRSRR